jgi:hypothetical protein
MRYKSRTSLRATDMSNAAAAFVFDSSSRHRDATIFRLDRMAFEWTSPRQSAV